MMETSDRARELVWSAEQFLSDVFRRVDAVEMRMYGSQTVWSTLL